MGIRNTPERDEASRNRNQVRRLKWKAAGMCQICGGERDRELENASGGMAQVCSKCQRNNRDYRCRREYGITLEEMKQMWEDQNRSCKICGTDIPSSGRTTHVDHDHNTGEVRGILCLKCNIKLGQYEVLLERNLIKRFDAYLLR